MAGRTISFPKGDGSLTHNNREFIANNVCQERTGWNKTYIRESIADAYEKCFGEAVREYNAGQKRNDRKINNYVKKIENSDNGEKVFYENIVQLGTKDDTPVVDENGNLTQAAKEAVDLLDEYVRTFQERNPNLYLFNCVMHLDVKYSIVLIVYGVYRVREKLKIGTTYTNRKKNVYEVKWNGIGKTSK